MTDIIFWVIPIIISLASLIVSIAVAWSNRKTLQVEISKNMQKIEGGHLFLFADDDEPLPYGDALMTTIEVVNPSPKGIAFFDLRAFYPKSNMNVDLLTKRAIFDEHRNKPLWLGIETVNQGVRLQEMIIPDTNYGVFKSNSFTRFHIIMFPKSEAAELLLSFKVAIKAGRMKRDIFAVTGRKIFKMYGVAYNITSWNSSDVGENLKGE